MPWHSLFVVLVVVPVPVLLVLVPVLVPVLLLLAQQALTELAQPPGTFGVMFYMNICALPMMLSYLLYSGELGIAQP